MEIHRGLTNLFNGNTHARQVPSQAHATLCVIRTACLAANTIGYRRSEAIPVLTEDP